MRVRERAPVPHERAVVQRAAEREASGHEQHERDAGAVARDDDRQVGPHPPPRHPRERRERGDRDQVQEARQQQRAEQVGAAVAGERAEVDQQRVGEREQHDERRQPRAAQAPAQP